jgi:hypothetical protein
LRPNIEEASGGGNDKIGIFRNLVRRPGNPYRNQVLFLEKKVMERARVVRGSLTCADPPKARIAATLSTCWKVEALRAAMVEGRMQPVHHCYRMKKRQENMEK